MSFWKRRRTLLSAILRQGYFYKGTANLSSWLDSRELLQAAHKYQVEPLVQHCARFLGTVLTLSNVCYIYNDAILYSLTTLREKCLWLILDGGFLVLRSKSFEVLTKEAVMNIITSPDLNMENELMIFEALLRWAPMQCCRLGLPVIEANILQELEPFLKFVCFNDMSNTEKSALSPGILSLLQPSNCSRVFLPSSYSILIPYFSSFTLREDLDTALKFFAPFLRLLVFSLSAPAYLVSLGFNVPLTELNFILLLKYPRVKKWEQINVLTNDEAMLLNNKPLRLEAKTVYQLAMVESSLVGSSQGVPGTRVETETVLTERGSISISIHCQNVYGITSLTII